jgi:hypothetical protein
MSVIRWSQLDLPGFCLVLPAQALLGVAYRFQQQELLQKLLAAALHSPLAGGEATDTGHPHSGCLVATAAVLDAVSKLQETPGAGVKQPHASYGTR